MRSFDGENQWSMDIILASGHSQRNLGAQRKNAAGKIPAAFGKVRILARSGLALA